MTRSLTLNAMLTALTVVATLVLRIPTPATQGYVNLGDSVIISAALLFGSRTGALSGGIGSALADILGGYAHWAPFTLVIKGAEGALVGSFSRKSLLSRMGVLIGGLRAFVGTLWMVLGYFLTETFLYGWQPALADLLGHGIQGLASLILAIPAAILLERAGFRRE